MLVHLAFDELNPYRGFDVIPIKTMLPYFILRFWSVMINKVMKRKTELAELLGDQPGNYKGVYRAFVRAGLAEEDFEKLVISFSMAERALTDLHNQFPDRLLASQVEIIMRLLRELFNINPLTMLEGKRYSLVEDKNGFSLGKWLTAHLSI